MNNSVAAAAVSHEEVKSLQIPDKASIFTAELVALNLALDIVWHSRHKKIRDILIFSVLSPGYSEPASRIWIHYEVPQKLYGTAEQCQNSSSLLDSWSRWC